MSWQKLEGIALYAMVIVGFALMVAFLPLMLFVIANFGKLLR